MPNTSHPCPGPHQEPVFVPFSKVACAPHWRQVRGSQRQLVSGLWRDGDLGGYIAARADAVAEMQPL